MKSFAEQNAAKGQLVDLGCGPGQTTKFLFDAGAREILGVDISSEMIKVAEQNNPGINFETADILKLNYPDDFFASAIAFYAIVHFDYDQLKNAFQEIKRCLKNDAEFLFSFHIGDQTIHIDDFLDHKVNIDFHFFETENILKLLNEIDFEIIDAIERLPYPEVEYPSRRAYVWVKNK